MHSSKEACRRKTKYTKAEALLQRQWKIKQNGKGGSIYKCEHCGKYHLTSMPRNYIPERIWKLIKKE